MINPNLIINCTAGAQIKKHRIVALSDADRKVIQATSASDAIIGVSAELDADSGERIDVVLGGLVDVVAGVAITRGAKITAMANGKATSIVPSELVQAVVDGASASTDISVTGLLKTDTLVSVIELTTGYANRTSSTTIQDSDGTIQCTDDTSSKKLLVTWRRDVKTLGIALQNAAADDIIRALIHPGA